MAMENCPCRRVKCERHGDCAACRAHHETIKSSPTACERLKAKAERKAQRTEKRAK